MKNNNKSIRMLTLAAMVVAMIFVAELFQRILPEMPNGGTFYLWTLITVVAFYVIKEMNLFSSNIEFLGWTASTMTAAFLLAWVTGGHSYIGIGWKVALFDYVVPFALPSLLSWMLFIKVKGSLTAYAFLVTSLILVSHVIVGATVWGNGSIDAWKFSWTYNGAYMWLSILITTGIAAALEFGDKVSNLSSNNVK